MFQTTPGSGSNAAPDVSKDPIAVIDTPKGRITIRLFKSLAPKTVENFMDLAEKGFFNGLSFHRVEPGFCIQGGDPLGNGSGMYIDQTNKQPRFIPLEIATALKHNAPGVVAMAHGVSPNSASSQFYITLSPQPSLDGKYAIFGGVMSGMDVVRSIVKGDKMTTVSVQMP
jgi:cyclophilin family peptidyl-prolyl cis-trans isomerase